MKNNKHNLEDYTFIYEETENEKNDEKIENIKESYRFGILNLVDKEDIKNKE